MSELFREVLRTEHGAVSTLREVDPRSYHSSKLTEAVISLVVGAFDPYLFPLRNLKLFPTRMEVAPTDTMMT